VVYTVILTGADASTATYTITVTPQAASGETGVSAVTVKDQPASWNATTKEYEVTLTASQAADTTQYQLLGITTTDANASVSALTDTDTVGVALARVNDSTVKTAISQTGTFTFTVTAEDTQHSENYVVSITVQDPVVTVTGSHIKTSGTDVLVSGTKVSDLASSKVDGKKIVAEDGYVITGITGITAGSTALTGFNTSEYTFANTDALTGDTTVTVTTEEIKVTVSATSTTATGVVVTVTSNDTAAANDQYDVVLTKDSKSLEIGSATLSASAPGASGTYTSAGKLSYGDIVHVVVKNAAGTTVYEDDVITTN
jgi:hypothetical protein